MKNFSFSHNVFRSCLLLMRQNVYLWNKVLSFLFSLFQDYTEPNSPSLCLFDYTVCDYTGHLFHSEEEVMTVLKLVLWSLNSLRHKWAGPEFNLKIVTFLSLSQTTNFKSVPMIISNLMKMPEFFKGIENNTCYEQFLLFPQCFQKICTADTLKPGLVWERVNVGVKYRYCWKQVFIVQSWIVPLIKPVCATH